MSRVTIIGFAVTTAALAVFWLLPEPTGWGWLYATLSAAFARLAFPRHESGPASRPGQLTDHNNH